MSIILKKTLGFTLIEIAVVLIIVGLLLSGLLVSLSAQRDVNDYNQARQKISITKEALLGFVVTNRRLPCPDTDGNGLENIAMPNTPQNDTPFTGQSTQTFACSSPEGFLPSQTLGVEKLDSWSNLFTYRVAPAFSNRIIVWDANGGTGNIISDSYFNLTSNGNITVKTRGDDPSTPSIAESKFNSNLTTNAAIVIISHGKNGYGATNNSGVLLAAVPLINVDETTNTNAALPIKLSRIVTSRATACSDTTEGVTYCEFDDVVDWLPSALIFNRMVATGQLP